MYGIGGTLAVLSLNTLGALEVREWNFLSLIFRDRPWRDPAAHINMSSRMMTALVAGRSAPRPSVVRKGVTP